MAGIAFQIPRGRYRRAEFFICILPGINRQFLLDGVRTFKQEVREFCILGRMNFNFHIHCLYDVYIHVF